MKTVLIPLPDRDFEATEAAAPWRLSTRAGHRVVFATEGGGSAPAADPLTITGMVGKFGAASPESAQFYREMEQSPEFRSPIAWRDIDVSSFDGLVLPGGHAPGMRQYLEGRELQEKVVAFWKLGRPVAAICHGTIVLARSKDPATGQSVIADRRTTCLLKYMELTGYLITAWKLGGGYMRTYPAYVEDEVKSVLHDPKRQFSRGPLAMKPGTADDDSGAFVVEDKHYISARYPGDSYLLAKRLLAQLDGGSAKPAFTKAA